MPLQKILFKPGVNRENTRYTTEGGWYDCDKIRFRQGTPEKIGGWEQISGYTYQGVCRSLWTWDTLGGVNLIGVGTHLAFYIEQGGEYNNITPIRAVQNGLNGPFAATAGSTTVTVTDNSHGASDGDFVTFLGAKALSQQTFTVTIASPAVVTPATYVPANGTAVVLSTTGSLPTGLTAGVQYYVVGATGSTFKLANVPNGAEINTSGAQSGTHSVYVNSGITADVLNNTFEVTVVDSNSYTITVSTQAGTYDTGNGGNPVNAYYRISGGFENAQPLTGWGAGAWGYGAWGIGTAGTSGIRLWSQNNFGQDLVFAYRGGPLYYWYANVGTAPISAAFSIVSQTVSAVNTGTEYITFSTAIADGTPVKLASTASLPSPLAAGTVYYIVNSVGATAQLAATSGGAAINLTTTGSGTITLYQPGTVTVSASLLDGTAIEFISSGTLSTDISSAPTIYYVQNFASGVFNISTTPSGDPIIFTDAGSGTQYIAPYGIPVSSLSGASDVPDYVNLVFVSDASRFTMAFGCTPYGGGDLDPMLIRWTDQESVVNWTPDPTNQAGYLRLSHGSEIRTVVQTRQEIVVFTDSSVYSLQYLGPPYVWGSQLLGDNISIAGYNSAIIASGVVYWMGVDKFYRYDGRVQTLRCDLRQYIYQDINLDEQAQFFAGTSEGFNEVWWFYCSAGSSTLDKYVVYNYAEDIWYYGSMARTAWLDSGLNDYPIAATYSYNLVFHEYGMDDNTSGTPVAIDSHITSSEFDIGDGHNFGFVWRLIPDITFRGSSATTPQVTMSLLPLQSSGSGYNDPTSEGGVNYGTINRTATVPIEAFTQYAYIRVRGRQMSFKVEGTQLGLQWQLGAPRIDIKPDGRRGA